MGSRLQIGGVLLGTLLLGACGGPPKFSEAGLAAAGRAARYVKGRTEVYQHLHDVVRAHYEIERELRPKGYLITVWTERPDRPKPDRIRIEAEVVSSGQGVYRLRIRAEQHVKDPTSGKWVPSGWVPEEEDAIYAAVHKKLMGW